MGKHNELSKAFSELIMVVSSLKSSCHPEYERIFSEAYDEIKEAFKRNGKTATTLNDPR